MKCPHCLVSDKPRNVTHVVIHVSVIGSNYTYGNNTFCCDLEVCKEAARVSSSQTNQASPGYIQCYKISLLKLSVPRYAKDEINRAVNGPKEKTDKSKSVKPGPEKKRYWVPQEGFISLSQGKN